VRARRGPKHTGGRQCFTAPDRGAVPS
jgi:hypothetical protein